MRDDFVLSQILRSNANPLYLAEDIFPHNPRGDLNRLRGAEYTLRCSPDFLPKTRAGALAVTEALHAAFPSLNISTPEEAFARWNDAVERFGEEYDPEKLNSLFDLLDDAARRQGNCDFHMNVRSEEDFPGRFVVYVYYRNGEGRDDEGKPAEEKDSGDEAVFTMPDLLYQAGCVALDRSGAYESLAGSSREAVMDEVEQRMFKPDFLIRMRELLQDGLLLEKVEAQAEQIFNRVAETDYLRGEKPRLDDLLTVTGERDGAICGELSGNLPEYDALVARQAVRDTDDNESVALA